MNVFKKTVVISVCLCVLFVLAASLPGFIPAMSAFAANEGDQVTVSGSVVNIRSGAGTSYKVVTSAKKGDTFPVIGTGKDGAGTVWYHVYTSSGEGYVISSYVKVNSGAAQTLTVTGSKVNVRSGAGVENNTLLQASKNSKYTVLGSVKDSVGNTWYRIYTSKGIGYVIASYVSVSGGGGSAATTTTAAGGSNAKSTLTVTGTKVNVRSGAGTKNKVVFTASKGQTYEVLGTAKDSAGTQWYKIKSGGKEGYIVGSYVKVSDSSATTTTAVETTTTTTTTAAGSNAKTTLTVTGTKVNVRSGAGTKNKVVATVKKGETYEVLGSAKDSSGAQWYKIKAGGKEGYIVGSYVKVSAAPTTTTAETTTTTTTAETTVTTTTASETTTATTTATAASEQQKLTVTGTKVNVRSGAGTKNKVVATVKKGQTFDVLGKAKDSSGAPWYKIKVGGKVGYIVGSYVKVSAAPTTTTASTTATTAETTTTTTTAAAPSAPTETEASVQKLKVTGTKVNVRAGAGTDKKVVATVKKDQSFEILGSAKDSSGAVWYKIKASGKTGYILGKYVSVSKTAATTTTTTATTAPTESTTTQTTTTTMSVSGTDAAAETVTTTTATETTTAATEPQGTGTMATTTTTAVGHGSADIQDITYGTVNVSKTLNVRSEANTDAKILGTLKNGDKVTILEKLASGWYKIKFGNDNGYVSTSYITNVTTNKELVSLSFKKSYFVCNIGATIDVGIDGNGMTVTYSSVDTDNAPITENGMVTGKTPGIYGLTAKCGNLTANCDLVVTKAGYEGIQPMNISPEGTKFIAEWEGGGTALDGKKVFYPYKDTVGYWTIGYGHAKTTTESKSWSKERATAEFNKDIELLIGADAKLTDEKNYLTEEEAEALLHADLNQCDYVKSVSDWMVRNGVKLTQQQFDALVSFCFNLGPAYWNSDTYMFYLKAAILVNRSGNDANKAQIIEGFCRYVKAGGLNIKGLWYRRRNEAELFLENDYVLEYGNKFTLPSNIQWDK